MADDPRRVPIIRAALTLALGLGLVAGCGGPPPSVFEQAALKGHTKEVVALAFAPDGRSIASRGPDAVKVWDVAARRESATFPSDGSDFGGLAFSTDGTTLAANRSAAGAVAWDLATGRERAAYSYPSAGIGRPADPNSTGWGIAYSPDGRTLAGGGGYSGEQGFVTLWDVATGAGIELGPYPRPVTTVAFRPDGMTLASGSMGGAIDLWDVPSRTRRRRIEAGRSYLAPVCFSPDGRTLAAATDDRWVRLWDVDSGREVGSLKGHLKGILSVAYHPEGRFLASADSGGTLFLWDVPGRRTVARLMGHQGKIWAVAFSPDGKTLASAGEDRSVRLWDVSATVGAATGR